MNSKFEANTGDFKSETASVIAELMPDIVKDGKIDIDLLVDNLGEDILPTSEKEKYEFTWWGKKDSKLQADSPVNDTTLIENTEKSFQSINTENIYIEGDNLQVLKLMGKAYEEKVQVIYLDPPYNTTGDFIYNDNFHEPFENYLKQTGQIDENGNQLNSNRETAGRYHTDWLNMIYPRIKVARRLLTDDGVIFMSINDKEVKNARWVLDEIFGEQNFLAQLIWNTDGNIDNQSRIKTNHEYVLMYAKDQSNYQGASIIAPEIPKTSKLYNNIIANTIIKNGPKNPVKSLTLPIGFPVEGEAVNLTASNWPKFDKDNVSVKKGALVEPLIATSGWSSQSLLMDFINNGFSPVKDSKGQDTRFAMTTNGAIYAYKTREKPSHVLSIIRNVGNTQSQSSTLAEYGVEFSYPKPVDLVKYLIQIADVADNAIVLDFFSGSASTAEAVMRLNLENEMNIKYIMVQLPELLKADTNMYRAGYRTIPELAEQRIKKAADNISSSNVDTGFKVYELASSNIRHWDDDIEKFDDQLEMFAKSPFKDGVKSKDIAREIALKMGVELNIEPKVEDGIYHFYSKDKEVFVVLNDYGEDLFKNLNSQRINSNIAVVVEELPGGSELKFNLIEQLKQEADLYNHLNVEWI